MLEAEAELLRELALLLCEGAALEVSGVRFSESDCKKVNKLAAATVLPEVSALVAPTVEVSVALRARVWQLVAPHCAARPSCSLPSSTVLDGGALARMERMLHLGGALGTHASAGAGAAALDAMRAALAAQKSLRQYDR